MINNKADEVVEELFETLRNRYQNNLGKSKKCSEFVFDFVHLLYYKCQEINLNRDGSYKDYSWLDKKYKSNNKSYQ